MNLQYVKNATAGKAAKMEIYAPIGVDYMEIDGQRFANEIRFLNDHVLPSSINIYINSPGGLVSEGLSIYSAIRDSEIPVNTIITGMAASIAGVISQAGHTREMVDYGRIMIHLPFLENPDNSEKEKNAIAHIADMLITTLTNNTKLSKEEVTALMTAETWLDPTEAQEKGFIDRIIDTKRNKDAEAKALAHYYTKAAAMAKPNLFKHSNMNQVAHFLNLNEAASEAQILKEIQKLKNENKSYSDELIQAGEQEVLLQNEVKALKNEVKNLEEEVKESEKNTAITVVEDAINKGIFKEEKKEELIEKATKDLEGFKLLVDSISIEEKGVSMAQFVKNGRTNASNGDNSKHHGKTFRQLEKEDPKYLDNLRITNKAEFDKLYQAEYGN